MIGVVADDITGAGDIGVMFAKSGWRTHIFSLGDGLDVGKLRESPADVVILDTNSRFDSPDTAYDKVRAATSLLQTLGCTRYINKTCSVFRGNIGAEFDAMLDALGREFAVVVLGFPKNGRTTVNGIHYVHGERLEDSAFRNDPVHPMRRSDLTGILQSQTDRKVALLDYREIAKGAAELRQAIRRMKPQCSYLILDVTDQSALQTIAEAAIDEPVLCGSSALAEELAVLLKPPYTDAELEAAVLAPPLRERLGLFAAAGSLTPQTAAQIQYMKDDGMSVFELDSLPLLQEHTRGRLLEEMIERIEAIMLGGEDVLLHSANEPEVVEATQEAAARLGLSNTEVSRLVSGAIAEIAAQLLERTGQNRLLIAGGDTSAAVCGRLGIQGMRVWKEIEPGLPSCIALTDPAYMLVLKSGSFGRPDFIKKALIHLRQH